MSDGIYVALSGAVAQQTALETTANNLANVGTPGFQKSRAVFREAMSRATNGQLKFAAPQGDNVNDEAGARRSTGRPLDIALGQGSYISVKTADGTHYTRNGQLSMAPDGTITASGGAAVLGEDGNPLKVSPQNGPVKFLQDGSLMQGEASIGRLRQVKIAATELVREGGSRLTLRQGAATPAISSDPIEPETLEESNVSAIEGMSELVNANRTFEAMQKALDTFREADRTVVSKVPST